MNNTANNLLKESTIHEEHLPPSKMKQKLEIYSLNYTDFDIANARWMFLD